jgi:hypothetical protein
MMNKVKWDELKQQGSEHYKSGSTEPIDLYASGNMFLDFALSSIIKYAFRSRNEMKLESYLFAKNMDKIIDYAQKLKAFYGCDDKECENPQSTETK